MKLTKEIIKKIKKNDYKTITALYNEAFSAMIAMVVRYKKNEEDQITIINNSFMKAIEKIEKFDLSKEFTPWICQITKNELIDSYRKEKNYDVFFDFEAKEDGQELETESLYDLEVEHAYLRNILQTLPPATNLVFNLFAIEGYTSKEVGEELNISYETVKWHIKEARKRLKLKLIENSTTYKA
ncbi:MAG: sigma-70 family RNA polymerase sigma factor [Crocinitomicaceae bacterium]|nr:sigma-70 family RNA polymerase sigma factor [Crocinitomicaceae bacterium]